MTYDPKNYPPGTLIRASVNECVFYRGRCPHNSEEYVFYKGDYGKKGDYFLVLDKFEVQNGQEQECGVKVLNLSKNEICWIWDLPLVKEFTICQHI